MLARIRKAQEKEGGFTLIELLVVMIIIGILAAIAIPVFLNQRKKAQDTAAKADVSTLGKEIATYYVDGTGTDANAGKPAISGATGRYVLTVAAVGTEPAVNQDLGKVSANVVIVKQRYTSDQDWCVAVNNPNGEKKLYSYSSADGLVLGNVC